MIWKAKANPAVLIIPLLGLGIVALNTLVWRVTARSPAELGFFWRALSLGASALLLALLAWGFYAFLAISYYVDRNQIEIRWMPGRRIIPLPSVLSITPRAAEHKLRGFQGLHCLGYRIGYGHLAGVGKAWFCTTRPDGEQWLIVTSELSYVVTPAHPYRFLESYAERRMLGPASKVVPEVRRPRLYTWPLWRDGVALWWLGAGLVLNLVLFGHVCAHQGGGAIALPSGLQSAMDLPFIGLLAIGLDQGLGLILYLRKHRFAAGLLFVAAAIVQLLLWVPVWQAMPPGRDALLAYRFLAAFGLSAFIAWLGYRGEALSPSGVLGAIAVGTLTLGFGGWIWGALLIAFFATSSLFSRHRQETDVILAEKFAKGSRRNLGQVLANGGLGALLAIGSYRWVHSAWFFAFVGAMSTVTADTWATELGILSRKAPRLITTWHRVPMGTSGALSTVGTIASVLGAGFIGLLATQLTALQAAWRSGCFSLAFYKLALVGLVAGLAGSLVDSLLGATAQGIYYCERCGKETESRLHHCGEPTRRLRGWKWLSNDGVNFLSSVAGGLIGLLASSF